MNNDESFEFKKKQMMERLILEEQRGIIEEAKVEK